MSFNGAIAEIPLGYDGLTGSKNLAQVRPSQLLMAENITYEAGSTQKEGGATKYNTTAITGAPTILGGWDWFPTTGAQRMVVYTSDGKLYKDAGSGAFATTLATGLASGVVPVFVEGGAEALASNRKLFCFNGAGAVQVLSGDGVTTAALATPPADWSGSNQPISGCVHEGRLWGALGHRVYFSMTTNHEDFTGTGSGQIAVYPGESERIVQISSFKGLLLVWKYPQGVYAIDTSSTTITNWRVVRVSSAIGGVSPLGACMIDDDILFLDQGGNVQLLSGLHDFDQFGTKNLTYVHDMAPFIRSNVAFNRLDKARVVFYAHKREAHIALTSASQTVNTARLVVDFNRADVPRFRWSPRDVCEALWLRKDVNNTQKLFCGDNIGFVWHLDQATRSKDGLGYTGQLQTAWMDLSFVDPSLAVKRKTAQFLEIVVEPKGNWSINVEILWDGKSYGTQAFNMGVTGAALGSFILDQDQLGAEAVTTRKRRMVGSGRRCSFIFKNSGAGEDFSLARAFFGFTVNDERLSS